MWDVVRAAAVHTTLPGVLPGLMNILLTSSLSTSNSPAIVSGNSVRLYST